MMTGLIGQTDRNYSNRRVVSQRMFNGFRASLKRILGLEPWAFRYSWTSSYPTEHFFAAQYSQTENLISIDAWIDNKKVASSTLSANGALNFQNSAGDGLEASVTEIE